MTNLFNEQSAAAKKLLHLLLLLPFIGLAQEVTPVSYCTSSTIWDGISWSNGEPDAGKDAVFSSDYTFTGSAFFACSVFVQDNVHINFTQNSNATITHSVTIAPDGELVFESGSNLIQIEGDQNTGIVVIKRNSSLIKKDALTLWSSPVTGQNLLDFSPETLISKFYRLSTNNSIYTMVPPANNDFETAQSYLIRTGENHPLTPTVWEGVFTGTPNNGDVSLPLSYLNDDHSYNAVGNPYSSPINIFKFLEANEDVIDGTIWLWRKTDDPSKSSYAVVTKLGYQSNTIPDPANSTIQDPFELHEDGILNTAQGFVVKATGNNQNLVFNNDMREAISSGSFFRTATPQKDGDSIEASRFWVNVTAQNVFTQILLGYTPDGTTGYDNSLDGETIMDGNVTLYTMTGDKKLAIEARPAFQDSDVVPLGFKTNTAGTYTFNLDHMDGLFSQGQDIYLKDKLNGTITNLNEGGYTFTTEAGTFETRFEIVYNEVLALPAFDKKDIIVYSNAKQLHIDAPEDIMAVEVYDMTGRIIYSQNNIAAQNFTSDAINVTAAIIVKITLNNDLVITKKTVLQ